MLNTALGWSAARAETGLEPNRVPLKQEDGLVKIACKINDQSIWMILDTGSQRTVLEAATAVRCGIRVSGSSVGLQGALGRESARTGVIEVLHLGSREIREFPCVVRDQKQVVSRPGLFSGPRVELNLLGLDLLHTMGSRLTLDCPRQVLTFESGKLTNIANATSVVFRQQLPWVHVTVAGRDWWALLDTAFSAPAQITPSTAAGLELRTRTLAAGRLGVGGAVVQSELLSVLLPEITALGKTFRNVESVVAEAPPKLGLGLLVRSRLILDFQRSEAAVETK